MQTARTFGQWAALVLVGWFLLHTLAVTLDGLTDNPQPVDCLLVLGNTVHENGQPSARLRGRLDKTLALYRAGVSPVILVSGGLGKEGHYEGTAMQKYLVTHGVPAAAIIVDNAGNTTQASARNFVAIAPAHGFSSVLVVSQFFHISRTKLLLRQLHFQNVYGAHARYYELRDAYALFREFFAYYIYLMRG